MSNLKQIGAAYLMYADDYGEWLLPHYAASSYYWFNAIGPYLNFSTTQVRSANLIPPGVLTCPSDKPLPWYGSYAHSADLGFWLNDSRAPWRKLGRVKNHSAQIVFVDSNSTYFGSQFANKTDSFACRHSDGCNILFLDTHVSWYDEDKLSDSMLGIK